MRPLLSAWGRLPLLVRIAAPIAWAAFIWSLSSQPGKDQPATLWMSFAANGAHAALFAILATLSALAWGPHSRGEPRPVIGFALAAAFGVCDEVHQYFVPRRHASVLDVVTDVCGALFAVSLLWAIWSGEKRPLLLSLAGAAGALLSSLVETLA